MPSCVVKCCKNRTSTQKKDQGVTYHRFPIGNQPWYNDWVDVIRDCRDETNWVPSKTSVICSLHFDSNDLYTTKTGLRRVVTYAVPKKLLFESMYIHEQTVEITIPGSSHQKVLHDPSPSKEAGADCTVSILPQLPTTIKEDQPSSPEEYVLPSTVSPSPEPYPANSQAPSENSDLEGLISYDIPRTCNLEHKLMKKQLVIEDNKRKLKVLNQKVRRLQERNKYLKGVIKSLRKQNSQGSKKDIEQIESELLEN